MLSIAGNILIIMPVADGEYIHFTRFNAKGIQPVCKIPVKNSHIMTRAVISNGKLFLRATKDGQFFGAKEGDLLCFDVTTSDNPNSEKE